MSHTASLSLTFLGTADSKGVPRFWCGCAVCAEARAVGANRRTRTALLLRGGGEVALLDAGGDLHTQLATLPQAIVPDAVFISHAHNDHILGLGDLLDYRRYAGGKLPIYAPQNVIPQLSARFPYAADLAWSLPVEGLEVAGHTVQLFEVPHGANGTSYAYLLTRPDFRAAIVTDAIDVPAGVASEWLQDLDLLVLGTSFADESGVPHASRSVYDLREARLLPWAKAARRVFLTHLSHDIDVRGADLPQGWSFARDGLEIGLASER